MSYHSCPKCGFDDLATDVIHRRDGRPTRWTCCRCLTSWNATGEIIPLPNAKPEPSLRPVQIWLPDTPRPDFVEECQRQARLLSADPHEREILDELAVMADTEGWTE